MASYGNKPDVEPSVIDEDELQRQLEEELANMDYQPDADDLLERQSNYSIFNRSQVGFNTIDQSGAGNMDDLVEKLLQKERDKNKQRDSELRETNVAWQEFLKQQRQEVDEVIPEQWKEELQDLKQLNQQTFDYKGLLSPDQEDIEESIKEERKAVEVPQLIMSDEKLLESYMSQQQQLQLENSILQFHGIDVQRSAALDQADEVLARHEDMLERIQVVNQGLKRMQDHEIEMNRLFMEREDKLSHQVEEYLHRLKFIQKDMKPPLLPPSLISEERPLKNKPVQVNPVPSAPMTDNFVKYKTNLQNAMPLKIDLKTVKILWSKEKEQAEEELARQAEIKRLKELEHQKLSILLRFAQKESKEQFFESSINGKNAIDSLTKLLSSSKPEKIQEVKVKESKIDIKVSIVSKDHNKMFKNPEDIHASHLLKQHKDLSSKLIKIVPVLQKSMPTLLESRDPKPIVQKKKRNQPSSFKEEGFGGFKLPEINQFSNDSPLSQVLELHAPDQQRCDKIEIKNEQLPQLELTPINAYRNLVLLNLSMNKIQTIQGVIDCPFLSQLRLSDNQIKEIPQKMLSKCTNLKVLNLDINQLKQIQNLSSLPNLEDLSIASNQIQSLDGIQTLTKLRRLNLSFNKITSIENYLNTLGLLEYLELGKNFISSIDTFPSHQLNFLTELYLYSNQLQNLPKCFAMSQLKTLNINRNQDLHQLYIGYCPLLETLTASYCSIVQIKQLSGCPSIKELDISFNNIGKLSEFMDSIRYNRDLRILRFSDNPFSLNKDHHFTQSLCRMLPLLEKVNGENCQQSLVHVKTLSQELRKLLSWLTQQGMMRQFVTKMMSQKIRITFASTTDIMKYQRLLLPFVMLRSLSQTNDALCIKSSSLKLLSQNQSYVLTLRNSVRIITSFMRVRRFKRKALLLKMQKHVSVIAKIQALMRGHLERNRNEALVARIKRDGPKKTKKYQQISRLQANIKGFLFRKRRIRALDKLKKKQNEYDDFEEFDADQFFGIKKEVFESGLSLPQEQMMQQMIQMMANQSQQVRQIQAPQQDSLKFPPINQKPNMTQTNMKEVIKPRSMMQQQMASTGAKQNRPPSARSNAISEIDMNSDT